MVPRKIVPLDLVQELFRQRFKCKEVADLLGVSTKTLERKMEQGNCKVRDSYSEITDEDLNAHVRSILENHPNTGMKMMSGFLRACGVNVQRARVRKSVRTVDAIGVSSRRNYARIISRRVYFVTYSNELWHIDTNLKLIRYKFVIKGCIDGKSRTSIYLDVADNNKSESQYTSFLQGVRDYGVPLRTRSDKVTENRGIAEFMLRNRGLNRGSHICGRSVHNQRIERFWVDVYNKVILQYQVTFSYMEAEGILDVNNELHLKLLHYVFLPRLQNHLASFRLGWNEHGLSSECGKSPSQLLLLHLPPPERDLCIAQEIQDSALFQCNSLLDADEFNEETPFTQPVPPRYQFSETQLHCLREVNIVRLSANYGIDVYCECFMLLLQSN